LPPPGHRPPLTHTTDPIGRNYVIEHRELEKDNRYRLLLGPAANDPSLFVAFVITATGFVSPRASRFLQDVVLHENNSSNSRACTELYTQLSTAIVRYNAMAALAWVRRLIAARTQL
jgi:hypothetical protein